MTKELQQKIYDRWPAWFDYKGDIHHTLIPYGLPGDGWFNLIWKLCEDLEPLVAASDRRFEVIQVKEKFGGLRFYVDGGTEEINDRITKAEEESFETCEECGKPGTVRKLRWIKVLCDECLAKREKVG